MKNGLLLYNTTSTDYLPTIFLRVHIDAFYNNPCLGVG